MVCARYAPHVGGVEIHVSKLAAGIARAGHSVEVLTQEHSDRGLPQVEVVTGVLVRRFPILGHAERYPQAPALWHYLTKCAADFDVVHAHSYHATPALAAALTSPPDRLIFTPHYLGGGATLAGRITHIPYRPIGRFIVGRSARIICTTNSEAAVLSRQFPLAADRIHIISNGIDREALASAIPFHADGLTVLCAGRLEPYKNRVAVVRSLASLNREFHLVVVGDGPERKRIATIARRTAVANRLHLIAGVPQDDMYRWYRTASVFVTMSARESFGLTLLEALVSGTPAVASDIPAHREVAAMAEPGAVSLVPLGATPQVLAAAIRRAAAMPRDGRVLATTWNESVAATLELYANVVGHATPHENEFTPFSALTHRCRRGNK